MEGGNNDVAKILAIAFALLLVCVFVGTLVLARGAGQILDDIGTVVTYQTPTASR